MKNTYKLELIDQFHNGALHNAYKLLGCHFDSEEKICEFRVFAPHASFVSVVGDFNNWNECANPMHRISEGGIWEATVQNTNQYDGYKYCIVNGQSKLYKSDPYAFHSETLELTNSKVYDLSRIRGSAIPARKKSSTTSKECCDFAWSDSTYLKKRSKTDIYRQPINIYEAHIGSWRKTEDGGYYTYRRFADEISAYLLDMGYTHIELMGVAEYPYDYSWGYQVTGYFAPTSRYGTPEDFAYLVDRLHSCGIGVIVDWVPGHFPKNANGLYEFDGEPLYEPSDPQKMEHKAWGTRCFDYARPEVRSFLISSAMMWLDLYHVDGLRVDAVASILYLDYDRKQGEWSPNKFGGNGNLDAVDFFQQLNTAVFGSFENILMIAEESTSWANVTKPVYLGGLGFNFKWNMGWMNDNLSYICTNPFFRKHEHNKMTFSMTYAFSENFILPISHDEVVYGKCSLLNKIPGSYAEKFGGFRNFLMAMYSHPGKKLLFMGSELASFDEWDVSKQLYWQYLDYPTHKECHDFVRAMNKLYLRYACFWEVEDSWEGFEWVVVDDRDNNVFVYERKDRAGNSMLCIFNFSPVNIEGYSFSVKKGSYQQILYTDIDGYTTNKATYKTNSNKNNNNSTLTLDIKALCGLYLYRKAPKSIKQPPSNLS